MNNNNNNIRISTNCILVKFDHYFVWLTLGGSDTYSIVICLWLFSQERLPLKSIGTVVIIDVRFFLSTGHPPNLYRGHLRGPTGSAVGHISIEPGFKARPGCVRRVFHLSLRLITFGRSLELPNLSSAPKWPLNGNFYI